MNRAPEIKNPGAPSPDMVLQHLDAVPPLSDAVRLAMRGGQVHDRELLEVVRSTPRVATATMRLCNDLNGKSSDDEVRLPLDLTIREAVALAGVEDWAASLFRDHAAADVLRAQFAHLIATSLAARTIAEQERTLQVDPADAFIAGLVHDLGKLAIAHVFPRAFQRIVSRTHEVRGDISDFERTLLGIDHAVAGRYIAERWGLPRCIRDVMWLHHLGGDAMPSSVQCPQLLRLIRLADVLAREAHVGDSGNYRMYDSARDLGLRLNIDPRQIDAVRTALEPAVRVLLTNLQIEISNASLLAPRESAVSRDGAVSAAAHEIASAFKSVAAFNRACGETPDLRAAVRALAMSAGELLSADRAIAFASPGYAFVCDRGGTPIEESHSRRCDSSGFSLSDFVLVHGQCVPAPRSVCERFADDLRARGSGRTWLLPLCREGAAIAGVVFRSDADLPDDAPFAHNGLQEFCDHAARLIGLAIDCTQSQRLSDDLAEANRCMQHAQLEVLRTKALSIIAEMAAGAGHEMNSPLAVISGRAQMLAREFDDNDIRRSLEIIARKAHECSQIVNELMDFARPRPPQLVEFDLARRIREQAATWAADVSLPPGRLSIAISESLPPVRGDIQQIDLVLCELLRNAASAIALNGGHVFISGRLAELGDGVEILVRDTGCGMSSAVTQRAFDPFFSHREAGRGRGLGLPRAHRIVEAQGGRIWLESVADEGTTARLFLPLAASDHEATSSTPRVIRRVS